MRLVTVVVVVMFVLLAAFHFVNQDTLVSVTLLSAYHNVPLSLVVICAFALGFLLTGLVAVAEGTVNRMAVRRLTKDLRKLETELNYLRTQPGGDSPSATMLPPAVPPVVTSPPPKPERPDELPAVVSEAEAPTPVTPATAPASASPEAIETVESVPEAPVYTPPEHDDEPSAT